MLHIIEELWFKHTNRTKNSDILISRQLAKDRAIPATMFVVTLAAVCFIANTQILILINLLR